MICKLRMLLLKVLKFVKIIATEMGISQKKFGLLSRQKILIEVWTVMESTVMNYPGFQFSKHLHFSSCGISIAKFVPIVLLLAEMAETHIYIRKLLQPSSKYYIFNTKNDCMQ